LRPKVGTGFPSTANRAQKTESGGLVPARSPGRGGDRPVMPFVDPGMPLVGRCAGLSPPAGFHRTIREVRRSAGY
jgi:hypothetical protein